MGAKLKKKVNISLEIVIYAIRLLLLAIGWSETSFFMTLNEMKFNNDLGFESRIIYIDLINQLLLHFQKLRIL